MKKILKTTLLASLILLLSCGEKEDDTTSTSNIGTVVYSNLNTISNNFAPASLASASAQVTSSDVRVMTDLCAGKSFGVCQSLLIREYVKIGKNTVDIVKAYVSVIGQGLGNVADGSSGSTNNGKISWNKTDANNWAVLFKNSNAETVAYVNIAGGTYNMKVDATNNEDEPSQAQLEATVEFTDSDNWSVTTYFENLACDATDVGAPSKIRLKMEYASGVWTGKASLYVPRWTVPGATAATCASTAGASDIAMYTDFVGNDVSTKAALYLIPSTVSDFSGTNAVADYELPDLCTNFASGCGSGTGQLPVGSLNSFTNNWCTTGPTVDPTWGDNCTSNSAISGASFSAASEWIQPDDLKVYSITFPSSL